MSADDWRDQAECNIRDPRLFDPHGTDSGESYARFDARAAVAVAVCGGCPVISECLNAGLAGREVGVWGGQVMQGREGARAAARRERRRVSGRVVHALAGGHCPPVDGWDPRRFSRALLRELAIVQSNVARTASA